MIAVADDSGLEVDALGGAPGIYSSRYAGPEGDARKNIEKLLRDLETVPYPRRTARFRCVVAVVLPDGREHVIEGVCNGMIIDAPRGTRGFGYDPVFLDEALGLTFAEMDPAMKNSISHRGRAAAELKNILPSLISSG